eukprot:IDg14781t1
MSAREGLKQTSFYTKRIPNAEVHCWTRVRSASAHTVTQRRAAPRCAASRGEKSIAPSAEAPPEF